MHNPSDTHTIESLLADVADYKAIVSAQEKISNPLLTRVYDEVALRRKIRDLEDEQIEIALKLKDALEAAIQLRIQLKEAEDNLQKFGAGRENRK